ncbi:MAG: YhjD/YihY/BrkB family envelope integrity protein [Casimicrobiaceae bacterium]
MGGVGADLVRHLDCAPDSSRCHATHIFTRLGRSLRDAVDDTSRHRTDIRTAFITAILVSVGRFAIGLYLGRSAIASAYGAAGTLVVLLVWLYYSAQVFLFGAEFTHLYATHRARCPRCAYSGVDRVLDK